MAPKHELELYLEYEQPLAPSLVVPIIDFLINPAEKEYAQCHYRDARDDFGAIMIDHFECVR